MMNPVGQNKTAHPHDAAVASGPLWCVPIAEGIVAVWHSLAPDLEIIGVETGAGLLSALERHRIFSPLFSKPFYVISSHGLQDGRRVHVTLRDANGTESQQVLDLRLAHWNVEGTPQIVSFIIARILPKYNVPSGHQTIERYLSLISSWRAPCRRSAQIGSHSLFGLDVAAYSFFGQQACFIMRSGKLTRESVNSFEDGNGTVLMTSGGIPERGYVDLNGELVEFEFPQHSVSEHDTLTWLQELSPSAKNVLFDHLSAARAAGRDQVPAYIMAMLPRADVALGVPETHVVIRACFQASGTLFAFLQVRGSALPEAICVEPFGAPANTNITPQRLACTSLADETLPTTYAVVRLAVEGIQVGACKIAAQVEGRGIQQWVRVQAADTGAGLALARAFWPLADRDETYLAEVASPLAEAWAARPLKEPVQVISLSTRKGGRSPVDLQVAAEGDLDALHGTLLSLRSSIPQRQAIRISLPAIPGIETACTMLTEWGTRYAFEGEINLLPAHAPGAAASLVSQNSGRHSIIIRAGFAMPRAGWLETILEQLDRTQDTFLLGVTPNRSPYPINELNAETLLDLLAQDAIVAVATPAELRGRVTDNKPVCHSLAGGWIEEILEGISRGAEVIAHEALACWEIAAAQERRSWEARLDEIALSRKIAAAEQRALPAHTPERAKRLT